MSTDNKDEEIPPLQAVPTTTATSSILSSPAPASLPTPARRTAASRSSFGDTFSFVTSSSLYSAPAAPAASLSSSSSSTSSPTSLTVKPNSIIVNERQRGNPVLGLIKLVAWQYGDIIADYQMGDTACALYISIRYHLLHTKYLVSRIQAMKSLYRTRIILCHVDQDDNEKPIQDITKIALVNQWTLICVWSFEEAARYLETLRAYEKKGPEILKGGESDTKSQILSVFHEIRSVNKTDVATLANAFGSLHGVATASMEELAMCPGLGEKKVKRIFYAFHQPFTAATTTTPSINNDAKSTPAAAAPPPTGTTTTKTRS